MVQTTTEPLGDPPKKPNLKPYLEYNSDKKVAPIESNKFRSYDGQWVDPKDVSVYPALS